MVTIEILTPEAPFSLSFGTPECALKSQLDLEVKSAFWRILEKFKFFKITMSDHIDPAPGAVELSLHGMGVGGEVAVRAHKDLRGDLPDEFQIRVLSKFFNFQLFLTDFLGVEKDELIKANNSKQKGNDLYRVLNFEKASKYYERGVSYLDEYYAGLKSLDS